MSVKDHLSWARTMIKAPVKRRLEWVQTIIDGLKSYRSDKRSNPSKEAVWLSDMIQDDSVWELIGFGVNQQYIRVEGDSDLLDAIYVHPWGTPNLVYKHKKLPLTITVGPGIRWNESVLSEMTKNEYDEAVSEMRGLSG